MTLELYVLRQLVIGLVLSIGGMLMVAIPGVLVTAVQQLGGASLGVVLGYLPIVILGLMPYLAPVSFLLTVVATFGRLAADNEWTAMAMAGLHPLRVVAPAVLLAILVAAPLHWVMTDVAPSINLAQRTYTRSSIARVLRSLSPGKTVLHIGGFFMSARSRDPVARNRFEHVFLHVPANGKDPSQTVIATSAELTFDQDEMVIDLVSPRWITGGHDTRVGHAQLRRDPKDIFPPGSTQDSWKYQTSSELSRRIDRSRALKAQGGDAALAQKTQGEGYIPPQDLDSAIFEWHTRSTVALSVGMFLVLGVATGLLLRSGSMLAALATAVGYALTYYLLSMRLGKALALSGVVPEGVGAWAITVIGTLAGVALCWKALRR